MIIPNMQKQRIIEYLKQGKRFDSRTPEEFRKIEVRRNISNKAEGSCSVKLGKTEVYVGVKLDVAEPYPDSKDKGTLITTAELGPIASPDFESGPPRIEAIELGRIIDRGIRESGFLDFKRLCIKEGEKVWNVLVDIYAINDDGNLLDVASLGALIALADARMPVYDEKEGRVDREKELTKDKLPLNKDALAFNLTLHKIGDKIVVDPTKEEEGVSDYRLSLAVASNNGEPRITAMQKGKESAITSEEMEKILKIVEDKFKDMFPEIEKHVWGK